MVEEFRIQAAGAVADAWVPPPTKEKLRVMAEGNKAAWRMFSKNLLTTFPSLMSVKVVQNELLSSPLLGRVIPLLCCGQELHITCACRLRHSPKSPQADWRSCLHRTGSQLHFWFAAVVRCCFLQPALL